MQSQETTLPALSPSHLADLAADPTTPPARLRALYEEHPPLRPQIAVNPNTPFDLLSSFDERLSPLVLENPTFVLYLLEDPTLQRMSASMRFGLARHPRTPPELLWVLFEMDEQWLYLVLASNPSLPPEMRQRLAKYSDTKVRLGMARSWTIPLELHRVLLSDASARVRYAASQQIARCAHCRAWRFLLKKAIRVSRGQSARGLDPEQQRELLAAGVWARVVLARQPRLVDDVREALRQDAAPQVQKTLARFPRAPLHPGRRNRSLTHEPRCRQKHLVRRELEQLDGDSGELPLLAPRKKPGR